MAVFENIKISIDNHFKVITIVRESKANALDSKTLEEIKSVIEDVYDDDSVRGLIITGEGCTSFSAGMDIGEIAKLNELNGRKFSENGQEIMLLIENCHKPIIAAIDGSALGGGLELAMACHLRVATEDSKFAMPQVNLGMTPGMGGTQRLTRLVGKGKALELMLTGDYINAIEAKKAGLINFVVSDADELSFKSNSLLEKITSKAPLAVGMVINCVNAAFGSHESGYQTEANSFSNCSKSQDFKEGVNAFVDKREPQFTGE